MSKRRHNFGTKRFKEKSLFIFHARIALKSLILSTGSVTDFDAYTLLRAYNYGSEQLYNDLNLYQSDNTIADAGQVLYASEYNLPRYSKRAAFNAHPHSAAHFKTLQAVGAVVVCP